MKHLLPYLQMLLLPRYWTKPNSRMMADCTVCCRVHWRAGPPAHILPRVLPRLVYYYYYWLINFLRHRLTFTIIVS